VGEGRREDGAPTTATEDGGGREREGGPWIGLSPPHTHFISPSLARSHAPIPRATDAHTHTHTMAGRDPDHGDGSAPAPPPPRARPDDPPVYVCGLEVGLLDVGRVVALNGYPEACQRLAFVSSGFYLEGTC
jgi:hypothetical protein